MVRTAPFSTPSCVNDELTLCDRFRTPKVYVLQDQVCVVDCSADGQLRHKDMRHDRLKNQVFRTPNPLKLRGVLFLPQSQYSKGILSSATPVNVERDAVA